MSDLHHRVTVHLSNQEAPTASALDPKDGHNAGGSHPGVDPHRAPPTGAAFPASAALSSAPFPSINHSL